MASTTTAPPSVAPIQIPLAAWFIATLAVFWVYLMLQENGTLLANSWEQLHELFHDGRHALGVPCH